eukprot:184550-Chlamydomonas_euryale.AAC.1
MARPQLTSARLLQPSTSRTCEEGAEGAWNVCGEGKRGRRVLAVWLECGRLVLAVWLECGRLVLAVWLECGVECPGYRSGASMMWSMPHSIRPVTSTLHTRPWCSCVLESAKSMWIARIGVGLDCGVRGVQDSVERAAGLS